MQNDKLKWIYLILLSIIWGSSFILIKKGLIGLSPLQLGALRIFFSAIILLPLGFKSLKTIEQKQWKWILISGLAGTGFPVFLFAYAETEIDSAIAAILNSSVPLLAFLLGILFFRTHFIQRKFLGVIIGLIGTVALILIGSQINSDQNYNYALLIILATFFYALNVNIIKTYMQNISAIAIATGNFIILLIPSFFILLGADFFSEAIISESAVYSSIGYVFLLSLFGTAAAKVMFNKLVQISDATFASSVTYAMTIISVMWGILDGEKFTLSQLAAASVIITGVYLSNTSKR